MAKEIIKPEAEKLAVIEPKKPENAPQKFTLEKLREHSKELFGISESAFAGASFGLTGEFTVPEMKKIIDEWNKKEAK